MPQNGEICWATRKEGIVRPSGAGGGTKFITMVNKFVPNAN